MAVSRTLWNDMCDDLDDVRCDVAEAMSRYGVSQEPACRALVEALERVEAILDDASAELFRAEVER